MKFNSTTHCASCGSRQKNIFCELEHGALSDLDQGKTTRPVKKRAFLFQEGAPAAGIFCLSSGRAKVYKTGSEGKQYIARIAEPGDVVGLSSAFTGEHYSATAEMMEDGTVCFIAKDLLLELIRRDPKTALHVIQSLAQQLQSSESERVELAQSAVRERMARLLSLLAQSHGNPVKNGVRIGLRLSREELAEMIGTASETAMRQLSQFKDEKILELMGKEITVLDRLGLARAAGLTE